MKEHGWPKGPWNYQEDSDAYTHIVRGLGNEYIGSCPQGTDGKAEATARLWAAAPEIYDALAFMLLLAKRDGIRWGPAISQAEEAIAKAKPIPSVAASDTGNKVSE